MKQKDLLPAPKKQGKKKKKLKPPRNFCLADNRAISCSGGEETMVELAKHIGEVFGRKAERWDTQAEIGLSLFGKHFRLDLLIIDKEENLLDIEPQESKEKHIIDRLTAYTAGLIYSQLHAGDGYQELKDVIIAFFCKDDPLGRGNAVEKIEMTFDDGTPCGAKFHWYVFSRKNLKHPKTELEWLLFDIYCKQVEQMHSKAMANRLECLKSEEGLEMWLKTREEEMKRVREEGEAKGKAEGKAEGKVEGKAETKEEDILGMLEQGFPLEGIAKAAKTSIAEVEEIARRNNVPLPKS